MILLHIGVCLLSDDDINKHVTLDLDQPILRLCLLSNHYIVKHVTLEQPIIFCITCDLRTTNKLLYYIGHHAYLSNHHNVKLDLIATNRLVIISYDTMFIYQIIIVKHVTLEPPISLCISYYSFDIINNHQTASV